MPGMTGLELLSLVRRSWPKTVGILMTACKDVGLAAEAINRSLVQYYIPKPWDNRAFLGLVGEAADLNRQRGLKPGNSTGDTGMLGYLREQSGRAAFSLARAVDARDRYTHRHSENVAELALVVGRAMGLSDNELEELRVGGLLHDVGKIGISDEVLRKPGKLTRREFDAIRLHPEIGASIVEPVGFVWDIAAIVHQHHEDHDGAGYPRGLLGDNIVLPARIIHVADAYEAMAADRVYRPARSLDSIKKELMRCRGTQFDPVVGDIFLEQLQKGVIPYPCSHRRPSHGRADRRLAR
jgi:putative nucleotidyltransferase with HDIG domain